MTALEAFMADLNSMAFFREFTFSRTQFSPSADKELELADNLIWMGNVVTVLQLKERDPSAAADQESIRKWFKKKVLKAAVDQIADSTRYLREHQQIEITNDHGHSFSLRTGDISSTLRVIVYASSAKPPEDCLAVTHRVSSRSGFIHIMAVNDYLGVLRTLHVPSDILDYFQHREGVLTREGWDLGSVGEPTLLGHFLSGDSGAPSPEHLRYLTMLEQDFADFDLAPILADLHKNIERTENPLDYYKILFEFAILPRSVWREIKLRYKKCVEAASSGSWEQPFKLAYPATGCAFMLYAVDSKMPNATDATVRTNGLAHLTMAAKYDTKMPRAVGITVTKAGESYLVDWCRLDYPWEKDPGMEEDLGANYPFRKSSEKSVDRFKFSGEG